MLGYVDSAIIRLRAVVEAETQYAKLHPEVGYTCSLSQLSGDGLIARLAKNPNENGYSFDIVGCGALDENKPNLTYYVIARPSHSGLPAFCADSSGVRSDETGSVERCMAHGVPL